MIFKSFLASYASKHNATKHYAIPHRAPNLLNVHDHEMLWNWHSTWVGHPCEHTKSAMLWWMPFLNSKILTTPSTAFVCVWLRRSIFFYPSCIRESEAPMAGFWLLGQLQHHAARRAGWKRTSRHEAIAKSQFPEHQLFLCLELWDV